MEFLIEFWLWSYKLLGNRVGKSGRIMRGVTVRSALLSLMSRDAVTHQLNE